MSFRSNDVRASTTGCIPVRSIEATFAPFLGQPFDAVITVCDNAAENCPFLPGQYNRIHWSFPDPAAVEGDAEKLQAFREVRDGLIEKFNAFVHEQEKIKNET